MIVHDRPLLPVQAPPQIGIALGRPLAVSVTALVASNSAEHGVLKIVHAMPAGELLTLNAATVVTVRRYCVSGTHCRLTSRVFTSKSTRVLPAAGVPA